MHDRDHATESVPGPQSENEQSAVVPTLGIGAAATLARTIGNQAFTAAVTNGRSDPPSDPVESGRVSEGSAERALLARELSTVLGEGTAKDRPHPVAGVTRGAADEASISRFGPAFVVPALIGYGAYKGGEALGLWGEQEGETQQQQPTGDGGMGGLFKTLERVAKQQEAEQLTRARITLNMQVLGKPPMVAKVLEGDDPNIEMAKRHIEPIQIAVDGLGLPPTFQAASDEVATNLGLAFQTLAATGKSLKEIVNVCKTIFGRGKERLQGIVAAAAAPAAGGGAPAQQPSGPFAPPPQKLAADQVSALEGAVSQLDAVIKDLGDVKKKEQLEPVIGFAKEIDPAIQAVANGAPANVAESIRVAGYNARNGTRQLEAATRSKKENIKVASDALHQAEEAARRLFQALLERGKVLDQELAAQPAGGAQAPATPTP